MSEKIKLVRKAAIIVAVAFWPVWLIGSAIAYQLFDIDPGWTWVLVTHIPGVIAFFVLWLFDVVSIRNEELKDYPFWVRLIFCLFLLFIFAMVPAIAFGISYHVYFITPIGSEELEHAIGIKVIAFCIITIAVMYAFLSFFGAILRRFEGKIKRTIKADRFLLYSQSYEEWIEKFLQKAKMPFGYTVHEERGFDDGKVILSTQDLLLRSLNCIVIIKTHELSEENISMVENAIEESVNTYLDNRPTYSYINMTTIYCVDRVSPTFYKLVNSDMQQGIRAGQLVVGISFGGKQVYVANQSLKTFPAKYKELRKQFMDMAGIDPTKDMSIHN